MDEHKEELATLEALDSGAVYTLALKTHVGFSVDTFRYYAGWCDKIQVRLYIHVHVQHYIHKCTYIVCSIRTCSYRNVWDYS